MSPFAISSLDLLVASIATSAPCLKLSFIPSIELFKSELVFKTLFPNITNISNLPVKITNYYLELIKIKIPEIKNCF